MARLPEMDRRAFLTLAGAGALGTALLGARFLGSSENSPFESDEERKNTEIARHFMNTIFSVRTLPEVTFQLFPQLHLMSQARMSPSMLMDNIRYYQPCGVLGLKKSGYDEQKGVADGSKVVYFDFETAACKGPDFEAQGVMVVLLPTSRTEYAVSNLTWKGYKSLAKPETPKATANQSKEVREKEDFDTVRKLMEALYKVKQGDEDSFKEFESFLYSGAADVSYRPAELQLIKEWNFCKGMALVNPRETGDAADWNVEFDFERPCEGEIETVLGGARAKQRIRRESLKVQMKYDPAKGKNSPMLNFGGKYEDVGKPYNY